VRGLIGEELIPLSDERIRFSHYFYFIRVAPPIAPRRSLCFD
jgi:hypothetical protein